MNEKELIKKMFPKVKDIVDKLKYGVFIDYDEALTYIDSIFTDEEKNFMTLREIIRFIEFEYRNKKQNDDIQNIYI